MTPTETAAPPADTASRTVSAPLRTNRQIRSDEALHSLAIKAKWMLALPAAEVQWPKIPEEDLARVDGNIHRLAGLIQMCHRLSREDSNQQVKAFFEKHDLVI